VILTSGSCKISGVPTLLQDVITYTIKATNSVGYSTATVNITIDLDTPKNLTATERKIIIALTSNSVCKSFCSIMNIVFIRPADTIPS
jgi:hypothetical protein